MSDDRVSLRRAEWLFRQRGCRVWREEKIAEILPLLTAVPDFLVQSPEGVWFFVELKSFEQPSILNQLDPSVRTITLQPMSLQRRVNRLVKDAANQMKPYAAYGLPIVVGLDNWRQVAVPCDLHSLSGLLGELAFTITIDSTTGDAVAEGWAHADDNSPLANGGQDHVSAVFCLISGTRFDEDDGPDPFQVERPMKVRILHNPSAVVPLETPIFDGPDDERVVA